MVDYEDFFWKSTEGLKLHARDYPALDAMGELPVICLPGLTRNARDFEELAPRIAERGRRVLAADLRGRGLSEYSPDPMTYWPPVYAADILAMMDAADIEKALFIGTSLGGIVTMVLCAMAPERVCGSVLNDIGPRLATGGLLRISSFVQLSTPVSDWEDAREYARAINEMAFPGRDDAFWDRFARRLFREDENGIRLDYDRGIAAAYKAGCGPTTAPPDMTPVFLNLTKERPSVLVRGALSDLIDEGIADAMRRRAPNLVYAEVPDTGHAPLLSETEAWNAIDAWLEDAP